MKQTQLQSSGTVKRVPVNMDAQTVKTVEALDNLIKELLGLPVSFGVIMRRAAAMYRLHFMEIAHSILTMKQDDPEAAEAKLAELLGAEREALKRAARGNALGLAPSVIEGGKETE